MWLGKKAQELELVDNLGNLDDAIKSAAKLAGLEDYDVLNVKRTLSENEKFLKELFNQAEITELMQDKQVKNLKPSLQGKVIQQVSETFQMLTSWNDPNNAYATCFCEIN